MKNLGIPLIFFLLLPALLICQTSGPNSNEHSWDNDPILQLQITDRDSLLAWQEKVLLHLSDNAVKNKGTVFFKAYLVTGPQRHRYDLSKVLRVELVDEEGALIKRQYHPLTNGVANGNLIIPKKIDGGTYYIRAYTRWMQNYGEASYAKNLVYIGSPEKSKISNKGKSANVEIFPEGGKLVNGLRSRIVIQFDDGTDKKISARITDQNGISMGEVTAYTGGLYTAAFTPESGKEYQLLLEDGRTYPMPAASEVGILLQVNNLDPDISRVRITSSEPFSDQNLRLLGELDGIRYLDRYLDYGSGDNTDFEFSKKWIPRGIMMLRLLDARDNQVAQRPVWIDGDEVNIEVVPLMGEQMNSDEHVYQIQVTDRNNNPVQAELALGVRKDMSDYYGAELVTGGSENFDFFDVAGSSVQSNSIADNRRERFLKDIRLLAETKSIDLAKTDEGPDKIKYPFQKGLELAGYAYDLQNNLLKKTNIQLMAFAEGEIWVQELQTDAKGRLFLKNLDFEGESELVFRTKGESSTSRLVKVIPSTASVEVKGKALVRKIKKQEKQRVITPEAWEDEEIEGLIDLEEVVINEKPVKSPALPSVYGIKPDKVRYQDPEKPRTIPQLLQDIPGVFVSGLGSINPTVRVLSGYGPILWVIDGTPIAQASPFASTSLEGRPISSLTEVMSIVPATSVERIELLNGANAAIYGTRASGGVFLIYTRMGSEITRAERKEAQLVFQGYEPEMDFEEYRRRELKKSRNLSNTLYWNPNIQTDEEGKATIRFSVPEGEKPLHVQLSTVTEDGKVGIYDALISK